MTLDIAQAGRILRTLKSTLTDITARDPEQEVQGFAIPALDAALTAIRDLIPDSPVISLIRDLISPEAIQAGEPVRAVDVLIVVDILLYALPSPQEQEGPTTLPGTWS
jgi:hypothetical protein